MPYQRTRPSRRAFMLASAAAGLSAALCSSVAGARARETILEPGEDTGAAIAKAAAGGAGRVRLKSGLYGPVDLSSLPSQIDVVGEPGTVFGQTVLRSSSGVHFQGVSFRGERMTGDTKSALVHVDPRSADVRFSDCSFATAENVGGWRDEDWVQRPFNAGLFIQGRGAEVMGCRFFHLRNCLGLSGDGATVDNCRFEAFGNDGIEFGANDLRIVNNHIRGGHHTPAEAQHADGMQGFPAPKGKMFRNIVIEHNVVEFVGPGDYMQGISIFDGRWRDVRIAGNTVSVNAWNAIALYGIDGVVVENNTVSSTDPKIRNWIEVRASKGGAPSTGVVVRNNVTPVLKTAPDASIAGNQVRFR